MPGFSGFASCRARLYRPRRAGQSFYRSRGAVLPFCVAAGKDGHGLLRAKDGSGKSRWIGRLAISALLLAAFALLLLVLGRPIEPRMIEVDVTDKLAESMAR
ncbi:MAG: hypothetical protein WA978_02715 [Sphingopyxis granuli]|uniref:hypothetical protein n=1 Tax=Sphingopyxis granuli TaxID=267128 RepID=UPI003C7916BD